MRRRRAGLRAQVEGTWSATADSPFACSCSACAERAIGALRDVTAVLHVSGRTVNSKSVRPGCALAVEAEEAFEEEREANEREANGTGASEPVR